VLNHNRVSSPALLNDAASYRSGTATLIKSTAKYLLLCRSTSISLLHNLFFMRFKFKVHTTRGTDEAVLRIRDPNSGLQKSPYKSFFKKRASYLYPVKIYVQYT
jgi:hypothetical protein